jgi:hypothetical protein
MSGVGTTRTPRNVRFPDLPELRCAFRESRALRRATLPPTYAPGAEMVMPVREAQRLDRHGKGGAMLDGRLYRQFPTPRAL